jgi:hypothetical protein
LFAGFQQVGGAQKAAHVVVAGGDVGNGHEGSMLVTAECLSFKKYTKKPKTWQKYQILSDIQSFCIQ